MHNHMLPHGDFDYMGEAIKRHATYRKIIWYNKIGGKI